MKLTAKSTGQVIWDAITDLHNQEQIVTREVLADITGLRMTVIDDHVSRMVDDSRLRRVRAGVFVPVALLPPARPVMASIQTDGFVTLEIGDTVLILQPREARMVGALMAGQFAQFSNIQSGHEAGVIALELAGRVKRLERELAAHKAKTDPVAQMNLLETQ